MKRTPINNQSGRWFDEEKTELFKEKTYHNGHNWISEATGEQFTHEALFITKGGEYILNKYSDYQGSRESYEIISIKEAAEWFAKQSFDIDEIPDALKDDVMGMEIE